MEDGRRILVVDDELKITDVIRSFLHSKGYEALAAASGGEALELFARMPFALVILDLMLPDMRGEDVCRAMRQTYPVPVIMLTARVEEADQVNGLGAGADDYITKPFSLRVLGARIDAVLRRCACRQEESGPVLGRGGLEIDLVGHVVKKRGLPVSLTPNEFKILRTLAGRPCKVFSREELIMLCLGEEYEGFDRTVDSHIKNLRRKIEDTPQQPRYIQTVHGVGYRFGEGD